MAGQGLSYPITVYLRTKEVIPLLKIGTIPSTGSISRMMFSETASYAKSSDIALAKVMDKNSMKYITDLVRSKGLSFPANLNVNNFKVKYTSSKYSTSYAVLINLDSTDDNGALSKDTQLISNWAKYTPPQKKNVPIEGSVLSIDEYIPSIHRATNAMSSDPQNMMMPAQNMMMPEQNMMMPAPSVGGRKSKRRNRKPFRKSHKYRKTVHRRKSAKRRA